jgi:ABC-type transporter Mla subunit MlaD
LAVKFAADVRIGLRDQSETGRLRPKAEGVALMMGMNLVPWLKMPGSGDVWQKVTNVTDWFSPKVEMNFAGDPQIEQDVNANVASYGKQLGVLTEAVIALSSPDAPGAAASLATAIKRLEDFQAEINEIKQRRAPSLAATALNAMTQLKSTDKAGYERVIQQLKA